ncbi:hypothetical protein J1605_012690, partial [Eschrichtius robustus]
ISSIIIITIVDDIIFIITFVTIDNIIFFIITFIILRADIYEAITLGTSLVAQWLRICLPMQGTQVRSLVQEDPTCRGATKPVHHNY